MKAIEANGEIDNEGNLRLNHPLKLKEKKVKVIILIAEEVEETEDQQWLSAMANNSAFDFLHDDQENIYSLTDGKPLHD